MQDLSIYVHVPFCQVKCPYCDFFSLANSDNHIDAYFRKLEQEVAYFVTCAAASYQVRTIFLGGGTPSYVPVGCIESLLESLRHGFVIQPDAEITLEMNPGSCEIAKLEDYRKIGINRISMGIQSFQNEELRFLGRVHNSQEAHAAIRAVHVAGFANFNLDFIFAIPGQTQKSWMDTLETALRYGPPHISAYNLTYEEGTPLESLKRSGALRPLPDDTELKMYKAAIERLTAVGLEQYEISNFSYPGREAQHNLAYWNGQDYLGLGVGAHSYLRGKRFSKKRSLPDYLDATTSEHVQLQFDEDLSPQRRFWELLSIGLRNLRGVQIQRLARQWGVSYADQVLPRCEPWLKRGYLEEENGLLRLRRKGVYYYDQIAASLIDSSDGSRQDARHRIPAPR